MRSCSSPSVLIDWARSSLPPNAKLLVPYSGGLDSSTCLTLAVETVGSDNVAAIHIEHDLNNSDEEENVATVAESLGVRILRLNLKEVLEPYESLVASGLDQSNFPLKNGIHTITLVDEVLYRVISSMNRLIEGGIIVGTLDLTECLTGYYPKGSFYGDFSYLSGLVRNEVRCLAKSLGLSELPESWGEVEGCGNLTKYINELIRPEPRNEPFRTEAEIDQAILDVLCGTLKEDDPFMKLCKMMRHKSRGALLGTNVFFPPGRREEVEKFLLSS